MARHLELNGNANVPVYNIVLYALNNGINTIIIKGSRFSAKTWFIIRWIISQMTIDKNLSFYVGMETRADHDGRTLNFFDEILQSEFNFVKNVDYRISNGKDKKYIELYINGINQRVEFICI